MSSSVDAEHVDPSRITTITEFGRALSQVRRQARITIRAIAQETGLARSTVGDLFAGRHLPVLELAEQRLTAVLRACGVTGADEIKAWMDALRRVSRIPGRRSGARAPYRGLESFGVQDAAWFFGRENLTDLLVGRILQPVAAGPTVIVGASGAGKSSLLRAGMIAAVNSRFDVLLFTPGEDPIRHLVKLLGSEREDADRHAAQVRTDPSSVLSPVADHGRMLLVVDQFEELYTSCGDEGEQEAFCAALCSAARQGCRVVLALRADFYERALRDRCLAPALQENQVVVGPMLGEDLRRVITEPARQAGYEVDPGLVELLLSELVPRAAVSGGASTAESGTLPLLSYALLATWERCRSSMMTVTDYLEAGGFTDAIARSAEEVFAGLTPQGQIAARGLFLRLVHVATDTLDTRRRLRLADLPAAEADQLQEVIGPFVDQRLLSVDAETVQISHEALLTAWPRLHGWLATDRDALIVHRRLTAAAEHWREGGRDDSDLQRGGSLEVSAAWAADPAHADDLGVVEQEFLAAATAREQAERRSARHRTQVLLGMVACLTALVVLAGVLVAYAFQQRGAARTDRDTADATELAIQAERLRGQDPSISAQLSVAAYRIARTPQARAALLDTTAAPTATRLSGPPDVIQAVALSPDRHLLADADAYGTVRLWNVARPDHPTPLGPPFANLPASLFTVAFGPGGTTLLAGGQDGLVHAWNIADPSHPVVLPPLPSSHATVYTMALAGNVVVTGDSGGAIRLRRLTGDEPVLATVPSGLGAVHSIAVTADHTILAAGGDTGDVQLWNIADPARPRPIGGPLTGPVNAVYSVAFSPDGSMLAVGSRDRTVWRWDLTHPGAPRRVGSPLTEPASWVNAVVFSPDGQTLAVASSDSTLRLFNPFTGALTATMPHPGPVTSIVWDGNAAPVTGAADGTVRVWALPGPVLHTTSQVNILAFSPDGTTLAAGGNTLTLWNPRTRSPISVLPIGSNVVNCLSYSPDGHLLAAGYVDGDLQLWNITDPARPASYGPPRTSTGSGELESMVFGPGGRLLAVGADDGQVHLWNVTNPARPAGLTSLGGFTSAVLTTAISPDGRTLAAGSADRTIRLWGLRTPARPVPFGRPLIGPRSYVYSVVFSRNGHTLFAGTADHSIWDWNITRPATPRQLHPPLVGPSGYVYALALSQDGNTLAAANTDDTVELWDVNNSRAPTALATLEGPTDRLFTVAFSPDGRTLAAGGADQNIRLWTTSPQRALAAICASAGDPLTYQEWVRYSPDRHYQQPCPTS